MALKHKIAGIAICLLVIALAILVPAAVDYIHPENKRYHQHMYATLRPEDEADDSTFNSHLPLVIIDTRGQEIPGVPNDWDDENTYYTVTDDGQETLSAEITVIDNDNACNTLYDDPAFESLINISIRGNTSRYFDKQSYDVRLVNADGTDNNYPLMGMDSHHEWALYGPILDKTLLRNYMFYNISGEIMDYAPNVRYCELVLNNEYQGLYLAVETITDGVGEGRLSLQKGSTQVSLNGYCLRIDRGSNSELKNIIVFDEYTHLLPETSSVNIVYPGNKTLTTEGALSIKDDFSYFEKCLYSYDYQDRKYGYQSFIDVYSFIDYFLINEILMNTDAGSFSTYIYKDLGEKYKLCVWDFNNCLDNYQTEACSCEGFYGVNSLWMRMLLRDADFNNALVDRYWELRKTFFSDEYLNDYIDSTIDYLGGAIDRNFEVWGYSFDEDGHQSLTPASRNLHSYDEAVQQLRDCLNERLSWLDENIDALYQYKSPAMNKEYTDMPS